MIEELIKLLSNAMRLMEEHDEKTGNTEELDEAYELVQKSVELLRIGLIVKSAKGK